LVSNGVDFQQFNSPARAKSSIPTLGFIYASHPCKGCDLILDAIAQIRLKIPELRCLAFGTEQPLHRLPLPENTQYFVQPPQHTLKDLYSQCDVWLFGSRAEGFGLPILEAMACRTPVIATPAGAAPELLAAGGGLLLTEPNATLMAQAIQMVCTLDAPQWQRLSELAYETACQYNWDHSTQRFEAALLQAVTSSRR
jgi:glycosyltransferase involved in cell wall biosynthesis